MATEDMLLQVIVDVLKRLSDEELKVLKTELSKEQGERYIAHLSLFV